MSAPPAPQIPLPSERCTLGCPILDHCLRGGIPCNSLTDIVGESSSGKTQLCLQLSLSAQLPPSLGGLSASTLFLLSETPFPTRRLHSLSILFRHSHPTLFPSPSEPTDNVFIRTLLSAHHLLEEMPKIASFIAATSKAPFPIRLLIIDSIAAFFRGEFDNTAADLRRRSALLFKISAELRALAVRFGLAVVVTNQVVDFFEQNGLRVGNLRWLWSSGRRVCPALGLAWANCVNTRLFLSRDEVVVRGGGDDGNGSVTRTRRKICVLFAPHLPDSSAEFVIRREGIFGVEE